jgi:hypothetical protein
MSDSHPGTSRFFRQRIEGERSRNEYYSKHFIKENLIYFSTFHLSWVGGIGSLSIGIFFSFYLCRICR